MDASASRVSLSNNNINNSTTSFISTTTVPHSASRQHHFNYHHNSSTNNKTQQEQQLLKDLEHENNWLKLQVEQLKEGRKALAKANRKYRRELREQANDSANTSLNDSGSLNISGGLGEGDNKNDGLEEETLRSENSYVDASVGTDDLNVNDEIVKSMNYVTNAEKVQNQRSPILSTAATNFVALPQPPQKLVDQATSPYPSFTDLSATAAEVTAQEKHTAAPAIVDTVNHATTSPIPSSMSSDSDSGWLLRVKESVGFGVNGRGFTRKPSRVFTTNTTNSTEDDSTPLTDDNNNEEDGNRRRIIDETEAEAVEEPVVAANVGDIGDGGGSQDSWTELIEKHCRFVGHKTDQTQNKASAEDDKDKVLKLPSFLPPLAVVQGQVVGQAATSSRNNLIIPTTAGAPADYSSLKSSSSTSASASSKAASQEHQKRVEATIEVVEADFVHSQKPLLTSPMSSSIGSSQYKSLIEGHSSNSSGTSSDEHQTTTILSQARRKTTAKNEWFSTTSSEDDEESETQTVIYNPRSNQLHQQQQQQQQIFFQLTPDTDESDGRKDFDKSFSSNNGRHRKSSSCTTKTHQFQDETSQILSSTSQNDDGNDSSFLQLHFDEEILSATKLTKSEANGIFKDIECSPNNMNENRHMAGGGGLKRGQNKTKRELAGQQQKSRDLAEVWSGTSPWIMFAWMVTVGGFMAVRKLVTNK